MEINHPVATVAKIGVIELGLLKKTGAVKILTQQVRVYWNVSVLTKPFTIGQDVSKIAAETAFTV